MTATMTTAILGRGRSRTILHLRPTLDLHQRSPSLRLFSTSNMGELQGNKGELSSELLDGMRSRFLSDGRNRLAAQLVARSDPHEAAVRTRHAMQAAGRSVFAHRVDEVKPVSNQRASGRCWMFACLNAMRIPFVKERNLDDFEFSQAHLFFWDKVERSNYFLHSVVEASRREPRERPDGRLLSFLLASPISDGGQWDMVVNLVKKHGVMPKKCYPETFSSENSRRMNQILKSKLREYSHELITLIDSGASDADLRNRIATQMETVFRVVSVCMGSPPPDNFTWEYYDKAKKSKVVADVSPKEFYEQHVRPIFDVDEKVCLVSDPREENPPGRLYTVDCLGNVVGGRSTQYNNQDIAVLMDATKKSIKDGEAVWFGCDVGKFASSKYGLLSPDAFDYQTVFGTEVISGLDKAQRMVYGESQMTHAMVITGVQPDDKSEGDVSRWRVENSWGEDRCDKGFFVMDTPWFREFVYEIVVDRKYLSEEVMAVMQTEPKVLPAWDPMGALAKCQD